MLISVFVLLADPANKAVGHLRFYVNNIRAQDIRPTSFDSHHWISVAYSLQSVRLVTATYKSSQSQRNIFLPSMSSIKQQIYFLW